VCVCVCVCVCVRARARARVCVSVCLSEYVYVDSILYLIQTFHLIVLVKTNVLHHLYLCSFRLAELFYQNQHDVRIHCMQYLLNPQYQLLRLGGLTQLYL
jgi:hypothetical protein